MNLRIEKWLVISIDRPPLDSLSRFLKSLTGIIDFFSSVYDNFILMSDFNAQRHDSAMKDFVKVNGLIILIKGNNDFKGQGSCIDLILTNRRFPFKYSNSCETGIRDHHHLIYSMLKSNLSNSKPKLVNYRDYKKFSFENFKTSLDNALRHCSTDYKHFEYIFTSVLNKYPTKKKKKRKAIMLRSRFKNKANKIKSVVDIAAYKKHRNYVVVLNQTSKYNYFDNLDVSKGIKPFWKTCKSFFSYNRSREDTSIILIEKNELILNNRKLATTFNDYSAEIVSSLNLFKWSGNVKGLANNRDITDNTVLKLYNHPSVKMIKNKFRNIVKFSFQQVTLVDVKKAIKGISLDKS